MLRSGAPVVAGGSLGDPGRHNPKPGNATLGAIGQLFIAWGGGRVQVVRSCYLANGALYQESKEPHLTRDLLRRCTLSHYTRCLLEWGYCGKQYAYILIQPVVDSTHFCDLRGLYMGKNDFWGWPRAVTYHAGFQHFSVGYLLLGLSEIKTTIASEQPPPQQPDQHQFTNQHQHQHQKAAGKVRNVAPTNSAPIAMPTFAARMGLDNGHLSATASSLPLPLAGGSKVPYSIAFDAVVLGQSSGPINPRLETPKIHAPTTNTQAHK
jgi:hypothetical protein